MSKIFPDLSSYIAEINTRSESEFNSNRSQSGSDVENNVLTEAIGGIVTSFAIYKLLTEIIKPFTSMDVFRAGIIDREGNILKSEDQLTPSEARLMSPFTRLVIGIKRLVQALPGNRLKADFGYLSTAAKAMAFECTEMGGDAELFLEELQKSLNVLFEEGEATGSSIGNSIGDGFSNPQVGEPNPALAGYSPPLGVVRRKKKIKGEIV